MISAKLLAALLIALLRGVAVAGGACVIGTLLARMPQKRLRAVWVWLLLPTLMPSLVIGYAYADLSLSLIRHPILNELFYALLLIMRFAPLAALVFCYAPAFVSPMALRCAAMSGYLSPAERLGLFLRGPGRRIAIAFVVCFVLTFGEFDLASRMAVYSWVVWIFDAQAGGLALTKTLGAAAIPAGVQLLGIVIAIWLALQPREQRSQLQNSGRYSLFGWFWSVAAVLVVCLIPATTVLSDATRGLGTVLTSSTIAGELGASLLFGLAGGVLATFIALLLRRYSLVTMSAAALPGLCGSLVIGLTLLALFQQPGWNAVYDTPLPLMIALTLVALPVALLLIALLHQVGRSSGDQLGLMLRKQGNAPQRRAGRHLFWQSRGKPIAIVLFFLCWWAYIDLPASALLAPSGMTPAVVRLYNLMHYGRSDVLSAMVFVTYALPLVLLALFVLGNRFVSGVHWRHA